MTVRTAARAPHMFAILVAAALAACSGDLITGGPLVRPGEPTGVINVINDTPISVPSILISDCDVGSYGLDRLPDGVWLDPGESYSFTVSAGCWDVLVGNGYREARKRLHVSAGGGVNYRVTDAGE